MRAGVGGLDWLRGMEGNIVEIMYYVCTLLLIPTVIFFLLMCCILPCVTTVPCYFLKFTTVTCAGKFESYWWPDGKLLRRTTKTEDEQTSLNWSAVRVMSIRQQGRLQLHILMDCSTVLTVCKRLCNSPPSHPPFCVYRSDLVFPHSLLWRLISVCLGLFENAELKLTQFTHSSCFLPLSTPSHCIF